MATQSRAMQGLAKQASQGQGKAIQVQEGKEDEGVRTLVANCVYTHHTVNLASLENVFVEMRVNSVTKDRTYFIPVTLFEELKYSN